MHPTRPPQRGQSVLDRLIDQKQACTWAWLIEREPRLQHLADDIRQMPRRSGVDYWRDWSRRKRQLDSLVGWDCSHPEPAMRTHEARDAAYDYLSRLHDAMARRASR